MFPFNLEEIKLIIAVCYSQQTEKCLVGTQLQLPEKYLFHEHIQGTWPVLKIIHIPLLQLYCPP